MSDPGDGISGYGTTVSGSVAGDIGNLENVSIDGIEANDIEITTMRAAYAWRAFIPGLKNGGSLQCDIVMHPVVLTAVLGNIAVSQTWTVTFPDGSTFVFVGYINRVGTRLPNGDKITQNVGFKVSGVPAFHEGSSGA